MRTKFVYVTPKSVEAKVDFETLFMSLHSCRVLNEDPQTLYLQNIKNTCRFYMNKTEDLHWNLIN